MSELTEALLSVAVSDVDREIIERLAAGDDDETVAAEMLISEKTGFSAEKGSRHTIS